MHTIRCCATRTPLTERSSCRYIDVYIPVQQTCVGYAPNDTTEALARGRPGSSLRASTCGMLCGRWSGRPTTASGRSRLAVHISRVVCTNHAPIMNCRLYVCLVTLTTPHARSTTLTAPSSSSRSTPTFGSPYANTCVIARSHVLVYVCTDLYCRAASYTHTTCRVL